MNKTIAVIVFSFVVTIVAGGDYPIHEAVFNKNNKEFDKLLENALPPEVNRVDVHGNTPLHLAVIFNEVDMIKRLIKKGADVSEHVNKKGWTPFKLAINDGNTRIIAIIAEKYFKKSVELAEGYKQKLKDALQKHNKSCSFELKIRGKSMAINMNRTWKIYITPYAIRFDLTAFSKLQLGLPNDFSIIVNCRNSDLNKTIILMDKQAKKYRYVKYVKTAKELEKIADGRLKRFTTNTSIDNTNVTFENISASQDPPLTGTKQMYQMSGYVYTSRKRNGKITKKEKNVPRKVTWQDYICTVECPTLGSEDSFDRVEKRPTGILIADTKFKGYTPLLLDIFGAFDGISLLTQFGKVLSKRMSEQVKGFPTKWTWNMPFGLITMHMQVEVDNFTEDAELKENLFEVPQKTKHSLSISKVIKSTTCDYDYDDNLMSKEF